jgi:pimeloyl-ACP methyl ester carboxylesterase
LSDARWDELVRRSYRANAQGVPEVDADPLIGEPLRNTSKAAPDLWPLWKALANVPILTIRGVHSDILSVATLARMHQEKPDLDALTVANRGHAPLLDEPECLAALDRFLPRLASGA